MIAILTGHTCGDACWHAREEICRCSCGGANHGILRTANGARPVRTRKIDGNFYELAGIVAPADSDCAATFYQKVDRETSAVMDLRFPDLDIYGYGEFRPENTLPVVARKISDAQAKWPEVLAVAGAAYLIWARPAGTRYLVRGPNHRAIYSDGMAS